MDLSSIAGTFTLFAIKEFAHKTPCCESCNDRSQGMGKQIVESKKQLRYGQRWQKLSLSYRMDELIRQTQGPKWVPAIKTAFKIVAESLSRANDP